MNSFPFRLFLFTLAFLLIGSMALDAAQARGGLVVQLGAGDSAAAVRSARTGRFVVNVLDADGARVQRVRAALMKAGVYGLVSADKLDDAKHLPYTENLVNEVEVHALGQTPLAEVFRVLVPRGFVTVSPRAGVKEAQLKAAGFEAISRAKDGGLMARKPWPGNMDSWTHSRHGASGNAVSLDTAVGPPERVRWVAAAMEEVEGLVSDEGRNFYGGVLARDSFNGLRLWHRDLMRGEVNDANFSLPRLSGNRARPVASGKFLFAIVKGKLIALEAATGKVTREYPGMGEPNEVIHHRNIIIASDDKQVRAFSTQTAKQLWQHDAGDPRNLAAAEDTVSFIRGRLKRGEPAEAMAVNLQT
ncbi:MAG: PQQ-binding-like beta-propeller repeat protein, partial [Verrucomicrobiales bacterium]|nr:PQQ-binding-like beta-propeller repeat protein [Verrucomicrobiales bacterium]